MTNGRDEYLEAMDMVAEQIDEERGVTLTPDHTVINLPPEVVQQILADYESLESRGSIRRGRQSLSEGRRASSGRSTGSRTQRPRSGSRGRSRTQRTDSSSTRPENYRRPAPVISSEPYGPPVPRGFFPLRQRIKRGINQEWKRVKEHPFTYVFRRAYDGAELLAEKTGNLIEFCAKKKPKVVGAAILIPVLSGLGYWFFSGEGDLETTSGLQSASLPGDRERKPYECEGKAVTIDGKTYTVDYKEGKRNVMILHDGDLTYKFIDKENKTNLNFRSEVPPSLKGDKLEGVYVQDDEKGDIPVVRGERHSSDLYKKANNLYHKVREELRKMESEDYSGGLKKFLDAPQVPQNDSANTPDSQSNLIHPIPQGRSVDPSRFVVRGPDCRQCHSNPHSTPGAQYATPLDSQTNPTTPGAQYATPLDSQTNPTTPGAQYATPLDSSQYNPTPIDSQSNPTTPTNSQTNPTSPQGN